MCVFNPLQKFSGKKVVRTLILSLAVYVLPVKSFAGIFVSVAIAPPPLPVYSQPVCPGYGYMWTPGYGVTGLQATTGSRACGYTRQRLVFFGPRVIGAIVVVCMHGTRVTGGRMLASTGASTMALAMAESALLEVTGAAEVSSITAL